MISLWLLECRNFESTVSVSGLKHVKSNSIENARSNRLDLQPEWSSGDSSRKVYVVSFRSHRGRHGGTVGPHSAVRNTLKKCRGRQRRSLDLNCS